MEIENNNDDEVTQERSGDGKSTDQVLRSQMDQHLDRFGSLLEQQMDQYLDRFRSEIKGGDRMHSAMESGGNEDEDQGLANNGTLTTSSICPPKQPKRIARTRKRSLFKSSMPNWQP
jgi:hypothetical protein